MTELGLCIHLLQNKDWTTWQLIRQFIYNNTTRLPDLLYMDKMMFPSSSTMHSILNGKFKSETDNDTCFTISTDNNSEWIIEMQPDVIPKYLHHYQFSKDHGAKQHVLYYIDITTKTCYHQVSNMGQDFYKLNIIRDVILSVFRRDLILDSLLDSLNADVSSIIVSYDYKLQLDVFSLGEEGKK